MSLSPMSKIALALLVIGIGCIGACGGSGGGAPSIVDPGATTPPAPDPTGLWITSDAGEGLPAYRAKLSTISAERTYAMADASPGPESADGGFSTTYTLEASIDEADIVKYDGSVLAVAPSRSACCFILEPGADVMPPGPVPKPPPFAYSPRTPIQARQDRKGPSHWPRG